MSSVFEFAESMHKCMLFKVLYNVDRHIYSKMY